MHGQQALDTLAKIKPELAGRFGVVRPALFGSTARDAADLASDSMSSNKRVKVLSIESSVKTI